MPCPIGIKVGTAYVAGGAGMTTGTDPGKVGVLSRPPAPRRSPRVQAPTDRHRRPSRVARRPRSPLPPDRVHAAPEQAERGAPRPDAGLRLVAAPGGDPGPVAPDGGGAGGAAEPPGARPALHPGG